MWNRKMIKTRAKAVLKISYWKAFLVSLVIVFVGGNFGGSSNWKFGSDNSGKMANNFQGPGPDFGVDMLPQLQHIILIVLIFLLVMLLILVFRIFLGYPLEVGGRRYFIRSTQSDFDMNNLGFAFGKPQYFAVVKSMLWRSFINFLWFLLLIIPGIIKAYAYRMVPYILADNPEIGYKRALELSTQMTDGQKFDMFVLDLSFIGWYLLGVLALFVGVFFVLPYQNATEAELYLILRQNVLDNGLCSYGELSIDKPV